MSRQRVLLLTAAVLGLMSCGHAAPDNHSSRPAGLRGVVVDHRGEPAAWPVILVMQADGSAFVTMAVGTDKGEFDVDVPPGSYAITIASGAGFARVSPYSPPIDATKLQLQGDCSRVSGRATGDVHTGDVVWLREMQPPHAYFGARVGREGHYELCVPAGQYYFEPDDGFTAVLTFVEVPTTEAIDVGVYRSATVKQEPEGDEPIGRPLVPAIPPSVRVVGLGESNHGTSEFLTTREQLTRQLASTAGVRYLMIEAGAGEVIPLNDYVQGGSVDAREAVSKLGYWTWDVEEFLAVLDSLREYNAPLAPADRLLLLGLDVQNTEGAVDALAAAAKRLALEEPELVLLDALRDEAGARALALPPDELAALEALLGRLAEVPGSKPDPDGLNLMLAARSLIHRLATVEAQGRAQKWQVRDRGMADMVLSVLRAVPDAKVCLWAHNGHVGKARSEGAEMMGTHLHAALGDQYYPVALLSYSGEARAWDEATSVGVIPHKLDPAPAHSVEGAIVARSDEAIVEVPFNDAPSAFREWLRTPRYTRDFGAVWIGAAYEWRLFAIGDSFDAAVVIRKTSPTTPTATGVRTKAVAQ